MIMKNKYGITWYNERTGSYNIPEFKYLTISDALKDLDKWVSNESHFTPIIVDSLGEITCS